MNQGVPSDEYEILVVDNGSNDNTQIVTEDIVASNSSHNIRYLYEPEPGLLSARHRGYFEAQGEILIFVDDDIEAVPGWLKAFVDAFNDKRIDLAGGPSLPKFEVEPQDWIRKYWIKKNGRVVCGPLSISFCGSERIEIDPCHVWGLNFAIRKKTLLKLGGFHPDCIPKKLQHFQGDGETGLTLKARENNLKAIYSPDAAVYHHIPRERLTVKSFEERFFYQGVCDSFSQIRKNCGIDNICIPEYNPIEKFFSHLTAYQQYKQIIYRRIQNAYVDGFRFHQKAVRKSDVLLNWVLRDNYLFEYTLPKI
jgi:glycosyltransferase involved in cell wall biosynthesis